MISARIGSTDELVQLRWGHRGQNTVVLRDLEEMSYEEIAEITQVSLGTVKSRLTRGREALRQRLASYVKEVGSELGLEAPEEKSTKVKVARSRVAAGGVEVMP